MNKEEAKILHGIYHVRELVGEKMFYSAAELNWLINSTYKEGLNWCDENNRLKTLETDNEDYLAKIGATSAAAGRPLAYLQAAGYITFTKESNQFRIAITGQGADRARELATVFGRLNVLYKNNKDGLLWFIATILVSLITALLVK